MKRTGPIRPKEVASAAIASGALVPANRILDARTAAQRQFCEAARVQMEQDMLAAIRTPAEAGIQRIPPPPKKPKVPRAPISANRKKWVIGKKRLPLVPVTKRGQRLYIISPA